MADTGKGTADVSPSRRRKRRHTNYLFDDGFQDEDFFYYGEIKIKTNTDTIISLNVKGFESVGSVKFKIQAELHIPFDHQELIFNEKVLENTNILTDLHIKKGSTLTLNRKSMEFMDIYIKSPKGCIIHSLKVKPSDTIRTVKAKLPGHVLMYNETVLEEDDNNTTLADLHIIDGSILTLADKLLITTSSRKTISLFVSPTYTIADVKRMIGCVENIPSDEQVLILDGMILGDSGTLLDFHINRNTPLTLMRKSKGSMKIDIEIPSMEGIFSLSNVYSSDTIDSLKAKIQHDVDIPCDEQELIFNGVLLQNHSTLADIRFQMKPTLTLVRLSSGLIQISIKPRIGRTIILNVKPSDTIYSVKSKIYDKRAIPISLQKLVYYEKRLEDSATLDDYNICKGDEVLHLVP